MTATPTDVRGAPGLRPAPPYDVDLVRADFPALAQIRNGRPLAYLDSAATAQKPRGVLDAEQEFYERHYANVHRGIYALADEATAAYESARRAVAAYIGAPDPSGLVFTRNATEAINLVAYALGNASAAGAGPVQLAAGDEICVTEMEHHSNLVPWQLLCERTGATLRWIGLTDEGRLDLDALDAVINQRTRVVAFTQQSNLLGTINPVRVIVDRARDVGALTLLDAAQSAAHGRLDVAAAGVDFVAITGHKMLGPTGIGALWGRPELLDALPPFLGGGEMVEAVTMEHTTFAPAPRRFEAGTPPIAQAVGWAAAVDYLTLLGRDALRAHEEALIAYALSALTASPGVRIIGPADAIERGSAISFVMDGIHPHDIGQLLDEVGVAVRVGHHCARPACLRLGVPATTRASFHAYTTYEEIDALVDGLGYARSVLG